MLPSLYWHSMSWNHEREAYTTHILYTKSRANRKKIQQITSKYAITQSIRHENQWHPISMKSMGVFNVDISIRRLFPFKTSTVYIFFALVIFKSFLFAENTFLLFDLRCATLSVDVCGGLVRVRCVHRILIVDLMLEKW